MERGIIIYLLLKLKSVDGEGQKTFILVIKNRRIRK